MLTKFETKSARVKGSEEEKGNNGGWMLGVVLSPRKREWEDSLTELGLLEEPRGITEGGGLGLVETSQSALLSVSWGFDLLVSWFVSALQESP